MDTGHRTAELRSVELHRRVAEHLRRDPELLDGARERVERWIVDGGPVSPKSARRWQALLDRPLPQIVAALIADSADMRDLRQNSPFVGVLSQAERVEAIRSVG